MGVLNNCRKGLLAMAFGLLFLSVLSCTVKNSTKPIPVGESWQAVHSNKAERPYLLYVPTAYDESTPVPLVLNFHGSGSNPGAQLAESDFKKLAEEKGIVVALPFGQYSGYRGSNSWNTGKDPKGVDDVQLTRDIIEQLSRYLVIDPKRIYATGMSGGARMVSRLACELDDVLAAVAPVAGVQFPLDCQVSRAISIITFHGKMDAINTYVHGDASRPYWTAGVEDSLRGWVAANGCIQNPNIETPGGAVGRLTWGNCRDGAEIVFYRIDDGGHDWPGPGTADGGIAASPLIWDFFSTHPLP